MQSDARRIIADIDAGRLPHARGLATDTGQLVGLLGRPSERLTAIQYLYSCVLFHGMAWLATARITDAVAALLVCEETEPVRPELLRYLTAAGRTWQECGLEDPHELDEYLEVGGEDRLERIYEYYRDGRVAQLYQDVDLVNYMSAQALDWVVRARPGWAQAAGQFSASPSAEVAAAAQVAVAACGGSAPASLITNPPPPLEQMEVEEGSLRAQAAPGQPLGLRAAAVYQLGYSMCDVQDYLGDTELPVRVAAALAPTLTGDPRASQIICGALADPNHLDSGYGDVWGFLISRPSVDLIPRAIAARPPLATLVDLGIASARTSWQLPADWAWGKYVDAILRPHTPGVPLEREQRRYLAGLVAIPPLWDPTGTSTALVFAAAGIPFDRGVCRNLVAGDPAP